MNHTGILGKHSYLKLIFTGSLIMGASAMNGQFLVTSPNYTYTQNFGTSVITAAGTNISSGTANLTGWSYDAALTGELNITAAAPTNTGGRYAYTQGASTNRKIGARPSGSTNDIEYGILFRNTSGQTIQSFSVSYTGYQLSLGGNTSATTNSITVDYIVSAATIPVTATGGTPIPALSFLQTQFVTVANTGGQGAGYPAATGAGMNSGCVSLSASIPNNSYLLIRWSDPDDTQNDPHLAIDDVEVVFFTNQTVTNNTACSLLPVELLDFSAENKGASNEISWKVAQEEYITGYVLERSENGIDFTELGSIDPSVASATIKDYRFSDPLPGAEITYYRLSTLEKNGSRRFYKIVSLENTLPDWTCSAYEDDKHLIVQFKGDIPEGAVISLYDMSGNKIAEKTVSERIEAIKLHAVPAGIYVLRVAAPGKAQNMKLAIINP